jgi:hypothetical protein
LPGRADIDPSLTPVAKYCNSYEYDSKFIKDKSSNQTWSDGWDLSTLVGFGVSSTVGYSNRANVWMHFTSARQLCGVNAYPGEVKRPPVRFVTK